MPIADGAQRLATRNSSESLGIIGPGEVFEVDVDPQSAAIVIGGGHRR